LVNSYGRRHIPGNVAGSGISVYGNGWGRAA
jgi:hypothetical protein